MTRWSTSVLVCLAALPAVAQAQPPPRSPAEESLAAAGAALEAEEPGRAYELARVARALDPRVSGEAWELMGRAASEMGRNALAHRCFRRALGIADATTRARLLARMQLARDELGLVRVQMEPAAARLFVDGQPAEFEPGERVLLLRPGGRRLEARLEGYETRYRVVQVSPGSTGEAHLILEPGNPDPPRRQRPPPRRLRDGRWLGGNAALIGLGGLGLAASGSVDSAAPELEGALGLQLGLSFGLSLGAALNMGLQAALDPEARGHATLFMIRILAVPLLAGAAMAAGATLWAGDERCGPDLDQACPTDPEDVATTGGVVGTLGGIAIATMANLALGTRDAPFSLSLGVAFTALTMLESVVAIESASAAAALRAEEGSRAEADARDAMAQVTGGLAAGFGALAITSFLVAFTGVEEELDLSVAMGPGTLTVSGAF